MHLEPHHVRSLIVAALIDRASSLCTTVLQHERRMIRPSARLDKGLVRLRIDEYIVKHVVATGLCIGVIAHIEPRT